jgi:hypothetical protein
MSIAAFLIIVYVQTILSGLIAVVSWFFPREKTSITKLIGLLFFISFLLNALALGFHKTPYAAYINVVGSMYDLAYVIIVLLVYNLVFKQKYRNLLTVVGLLFITGAVLNLVLFQKLEITSYTKFAGSFIIVALCIYFFYKLLVELPTVHLQELPMFWISSAFLMYSSGGIFLYAFTDYLVNVLDDDLALYWSFHNLLFIAHDMFIIVGISVRNRSGKTTGEGHVRNP